MGRITIKDIARILEVSPSTVSRALKNHPDISKARREHIQKIAKELGYTPNYQAIGFRNKKSGLIGLLIPDMNMYFFPFIIKAVEENIRQKGYNLIVLHSNNRLETEIENVRICQRFGVEGILVSLSSETQSLDHFEQLEKHNIPVVYFDRILEVPNKPLVVIDDVAAVRTALEHLIGTGRKHIAGFFGNKHLTISKKRHQGFISTLQKYNLTAPESFVQFAHNSAQAQAATSALFNFESIPDAIFSMSDELLVGIMQALQQTNLKIPEDIAVITISNGVVPHFFTPSISFVEHSADKVGNLAANILFELLETQPQEHYPRYIETQLVIRNST